MPELDSDPAWRPAAAFVLGYPRAYARAYFGDIRAWCGWCAGIGLAPLMRGGITWTAGSPSRWSGRPVAAA